MCDEFFIHQWNDFFFLFSFRDNIEWSALNGAISHKVLLNYLFCHEIFVCLIVTEDFFLLRQNWHSVYVIFFHCCSLKKKYFFFSNNLIMFAKQTKPTADKDTIWIDDCNKNHMTGCLHPLNRRSIRVIENANAEKNIYERMNLLHENNMNYWGQLLQAMPGIYFWYNTIIFFRTSNIFSYFPDLNCIVRFLDTHTFRKIS